MKKLICKRCINKVIRLRVLLGVLFVGAVPASAQIEIRADLVETFLRNQQTARTYSGQVNFTDSERKIQIKADSARVNGRQFFFLSNLSFQDTTRLIKAARLIYDDSLKSAVFYGGVVLQEKGRHLLADTVSVWTETGMLEAKGQVRYAWNSYQNFVSSQHLTYQNDIAEGVARQDVTLLLAGTDSIEINTEWLKFRPERSWFVFEGQSKIRQKDMVLRANQGRYMDTVLVAVGKPQMMSRQSETRTVQTFADSIVATLNDRQIRGFSLFSGFEMRVEDQADSSFVSQVVRGDSAFAQVMNKQISFLRVVGQPKLTHLQEDREVEMSGDTLDVSYQKGQIDSLRVTGSSLGILTEAGLLKSRISGTKQVAWFLQDQLENLVVFGNAACWYQDAVKGKRQNVEVRGDVVGLQFEDGALIKMQADGKVTGVYGERTGDVQP